MAATHTGSPIFTLKGALENQEIENATNPRKMISLEEAKQAGLMESKRGGVIDEAVDKEFPITENELTTMARPTHGSRDATGRAMAEMLK